MKKVFFLLAIVAMTVVSCNTTKQFTDSVNKFLKDHNYQKTSVFNEKTKSTKITVSVENLYDTSKVKEICTQADVTLEISKAKITIISDCPGAEQKIQDILKQLTSAVVFKK